MADTDMSNDVLTRVVPQDGWSPIICRRVPITQTISNIVGDKGNGEIWLGGRIKNFHAKIHVQDQYSGSRVPADILTQESTDYGETWGDVEVEEHYEGDFELDYEGHERDFEVRLNGNSLYIRYRWLMNGQEIADASGSLEHTITVTDYPVKLEVDARYADNYGTHEIGDYTFNSAKVTMKSGVVKDVDEDDLTTPSEDIEWADKDGWQTQTWSYTENGRTVTAQVGARITALRDVAIDVEIDPVYAWGNEDGKDYWCLSRDGEDTYIFKEGYTVSKSDLRVTVTRNDGSTPYATQDYWMPNNYPLGRGKQSITVQKGSLSKTLPVTVAYSTKVEVGNVSGGIGTASLEDMTVYFIEVEAPPALCRNDAPSYFLKDAEGSDCDNEVLGGESELFVNGNPSIPVSADKYYLWAFTKGELDKTYYYFHHSTDELMEPVTPIGAGGGDFIKSSFYEYGEYVEPTHYKAYYECYDGTEGFDEVSEIDGEWEGKVESVKGYQKFSNEYANLRLYEIEGITDSDYNEDGELWVYGWEESKDYFKVQLATYQDLLDESFDEVFTIKEGCGYILWDLNSESRQDFFYNDGDLYLGQYYRCNVAEDGEVLSAEPLTPYPLSEMPEASSAVIGEYGSEVGTLTLGKKSYLYRVGLEPIDEENYLFIKDFKDKPFNYGLVKCYEPELQVEPEPVGFIEAKYEDGGVYAYPVEFPELMVGTVTLFGTSIEGWAVTSSDSSVMAVLSDEIIKDWAMALSEVDEGYYLISSSEKLRKDIDVRYEDGTSVVFVEGGGVINPIMDVSGFYVYKVQRPTTEPGKVTGPGGVEYRPWFIKDSPNDMILSEEMASIYGLPEGVYLLTTQPTIPEGTKLLIEGAWDATEWEEVVFIK